MRVAILLLLAACGAQNPPESDVAEDTPADVIEDTSEDALEDPAQDALRGVDATEVDAEVLGLLADVLAVEVQGTNLAVTIRSPDLGCDQYASWWEVVGEDGTLLYRRILDHSHVDEQPFTRNGGPVTSDAVLIVRAHMAPGGYGGVVFRGTLRDGFSAAPDIDADFAEGLAEEAPLPSSCAF